MKLTKKRVLELTLELWQWLYDNPNKRKENWPGWEGNGGSYYSETKCFACSYTFAQKDGDGCNLCPLLPLWPDGCTASSQSPYMQWVMAKSRKDRKKYTKEIVDFCKKELAI